ncbi:UNVERIFIED_CONTAM: hypothetical protein K2H54_017881 [Gekko kuhli]
MAASMMRCCLRAVSVQCPSPIFTRIGKHSAVVPAFANLLISNRPYASEKKSSKKKGKKKTATPEPLYKKKRYEGELPSGPTDDVYLTWCYQRPIYEAEVAIDMLKNFQELDFTSPRQFVYADITLDMSMDKKKPVDPFTATLLLPHRFLDNTHKVLVFTEVSRYLQFQHFLLPRMCLRCQRVKTELKNDSETLFPNESSYLTKYEQQQM